MKEIIIKSYNREAEIYDTKFSPLQQLKYKTMLAFFNHDFFSDKSIIDLGCGTGLFPDYLTNNKIPYKEYLGIDIADKMIFNAMKKGYRCTTGDCTTLHQSNCKYDIAVSFTVLRIFNSDDDYNFIHNLKRILKSQGFFICTILSGKVDAQWHQLMKTHNFCEVFTAEAGQDTGFIYKNNN